MELRRRPGPEVALPEPWGAPIAGSEGVGNASPFSRAGQARPSVGPLTDIIGNLRSAHTETGRRSTFQQVVHTVRAFVHPRRPRPRHCEESPVHPVPGVNWWYSDQPGSHGSEWGSNVRALGGRRTSNGNQDRDRRGQCDAAVGSVPPVSRQLPAGRRTTFESRTCPARYLGRSVNRRPGVGLWRGLVRRSAPRGLRHYKLRGNTLEITGRSLRAAPRHADHTESLLLLDPNRRATRRRLRLRHKRARRRGPCVNHGRQGTSQEFRPKSREPSLLLAIAPSPPASDPEPAHAALPTRPRARRGAGPC